MQKKIDFILKLGMFVFSIFILTFFIMEMKFDTITINGSIVEVTRFENILLSILFGFLFLIVFFLVPPFGLITYYLIYRTVTQNKIRKNAKFERQNLEYCREHLNQLSPPILSYLENFEIEYEKDLSAHILKLIYEKKIAIQNQKLIVINQDTSSESDLYVLNLVQNKKKGFKNQYEKIIEKEARSQGFLTSKDVALHKFIAIFLIGFLAFPLLFNIIFFYFAHNINNLSILSIFIVGFSTVLPILVFAFTFIQIFSIFKTKTNMIRTKKGNQILKNALGLKEFLKDFSTLENSSWKEVYTRDYYLIYAVVLNLNKRITKEIMEMLEN